MKSTLVNVSVTILLILSAILIIRFFFWPDTSEIDRLREKIARTHAIVDSLENENNKLISEVDSIQTAYEQRSQIIQRLSLQISTQKREHEKALRRIYEFKGTDDDLLAELNRLIHVQLADSTD